MLVNFFDRIVIPAFFLDVDHRIIGWNPAMEALSGLSRDLMLGSKTQWKAFYSEERPVLADLVLEPDMDAQLELYYSGRYEHCEVVSGGINGTDYFPNMPQGPKWMSFSASVVYDQYGNRCGAVETVLDITEQKHFAALLIKRERHFRELSITDQLTGVYNSRYLHRQLQEELSRSSRSAQVFSICMLDLDNFKNVNDQYGHLAGDDVLQFFANIIKENLRKQDRAFRFGGEEFLILLPDTTTQSAYVVAERIRESLVLRQHFLDTGVKPVTVSIGITEYKEGDQEATLIGRADDALYRAKAAGKNCTIISA